MPPSPDPQFKTAIPYEYDILGTDIRFDVRDDTLDVVRLVIRSRYGYICETGMLHRDDPKKVAVAMIAAARKLYAFTDDEITAIKPALGIMERFMSQGVPASAPDGSVAANNAFI